MLFQNMFHFVDIFQRSTFFVPVEISRICLLDTKYSVFFDIGRVTWTLCLEKKSEAPTSKNYEAEV